MFKKACELLNENNLSIFFFESASAGYLAYQFSLSPFSGKILLGSLVCYDLTVKESILKIPSSIIKKYTAESMEVTEEMIKKGKTIIKSDIYISCTGLLKKGGSESKEKPIGTFFYAIYYKNRIYNFRSLHRGQPQKKLANLLINICNNLINIIENENR